MRIIAGQHRGIRLASVGRGDTAAHLRPTSDRVRESLFSVLMGGAYGDPISGTRVLDLFAGTGALGLEALSRGARHVTFVDDGRKAQGLIRQNIRLLHRQADTKLMAVNALRLPPNPDAPYDLIFLDPPYGKKLGQAALNTARKGGWLAPDALIIWEEDSPQPADEGYDLHDQRRYGGSWVSIMQRVDAG
ncbi:MAG: 16S rRNA (guanine(966)-N(2))-methyltransferase RsmD [Rhodobacterales bacterium]|nr:MAG: 16S rRNA (guanine(966)-N(2))-methyltransferase RsmD [Rhodobacterales bacterium]